MEERNRSTVWWVVGILVGLFIVCVVSAFVGGIAGYVAGQRAAVNVVPRMGPFPFERDERMPMPMPRMPRQPMPRAPEEWAPGVSAGAVIVDIVQDSPAAEAGLRPGDVIVAINGEGFDRDDTLGEMLDDFEPGDMIELTVMRGGELAVRPLELGRRPGRADDQPYMGLSYRMVPRMQFDPDSGR
jgi:S1-C subfamily serine protease